MTQQILEQTAVDALQYRYQHLPLTGRILLSRNERGVFVIAIESKQPVYLADGTRINDPIFTADIRDASSAPVKQNAPVKFKWKTPCENVTKKTPKEWEKSLQRDELLLADCVESLSQQEERELTNKLVDLSHEKYQQARNFLKDEEAIIQNEKGSLNLQIKAWEAEKEQTTYQINQAKQELAPFLALLPESQNTSKATSVESVSTSELIKIWMSTMNAYGFSTAKQESVAKSYLVSVLTAWYEGSIVLLSGPVGTGKTQIIETTACFLSGSRASATVIPVRPSWMDSTDLLGFFDPTNECFRPTSFTTALVQAKQSEQFNLLNLICLDELNLARIENYGADLLSRLEYGAARNKSNAGDLPLYSKDIARRLLDRIKFAGDEAGRNSDLVSIAYNLNEYPPSLFLPKNLVLLGTLNSDETTYEISPKVIDRSFVINFPLSNLRINFPADEASLSPMKDPREMLVDTCRCLNLADFESTIRLAPINPSARIWERLCNFEDKYMRKGLGIPLSYRARNHFLTFMKIARALGIQNENEMLAHFVFSKYLPRIKFSKGNTIDTNQNQSTDELFTEFLDEIERNFSMYDPSNVIEDLRRQLSSNGRRIVRYFGGDL